MSKFRVQHTGIQNFHKTKEVVVVLHGHKQRDLFDRVSTHASDREGIIKKYMYILLHAEILYSQ